MKKLTAGIFATLLTVVTVGVANADIASTAWVNSKIGEVNTGVDNKIEGVQQTVNSQATEIAELDEQVLGLASEVENKLDTATASQTYATKAALDSKLNKNLGTGSSGNILTVGSDGAITSSATIAQGKVNGLTAALNAKADASDLTTLETEVGKKLDSTTASNTYATKSALNAKADASALTALEQTVEGKADASALTTLETEVGNKLDKNLGTGKSGNILTVGSDGAITSSATIAQGKVNGLTAALNAKANASDLTTLETEVGKKLDSTTASNTYATKTELEDYATTEELTSGLANKLDTETASQTYATKTALNAKADATALTELETEVGDKQDKLTTTQLNAVNSGITAAKVNTYDGYDSKITTATNTANTAKTAADAATEAANAAKSAAETATSTANAAKSAADAATEAAQSAASSASSAVASANKAIPKPADTEVNSDGVFVLTYKIGTGYAWELISR